MKIIADLHIPFVQNYFADAGDLVLKPGRMISPDDVKDADILLVRSITPVHASLLKESRVQFVGSITTGADHVDQAWLKTAKIDFGFASGFNAQPVSDYVMSVIAALQKKKLLPQKGMKAAVIGVGNIGRIVAERLKLLHFEVILCDPFRAEIEKNIAFVPLNEIGDVDFISLHVPFTQDGPYPTYHFIEKNFLKRQKAGCILLNTSRGAVMDRDALKQHGNHLRWCFDVWEEEPCIDKMLLEKAFIATPHIAGYSVQSKMRGIEMIYRIACDRKIIQPRSIFPSVMPHKQLHFSGQCHWQDVVLSLFDPLEMTHKMKTALLPSKEYAFLFDEMRNQFTERHEFQHTEMQDVNTPEEEKNLLKGLGFLIGKVAHHYLF